MENDSSKYIDQLATSRVRLPVSASKSYMRKAYDVFPKT